MDFDEKQGDEPKTRYSGRPAPVVHKENAHIYTVEKTGNMRVPVKIYTSDALLSQLTSDDSLHQACNVATLPGIVEASIAMPDAHQGYGFCIGGVAAFDMQEGIISPGGIGFDINCGVRLLRTNLTKEQVLPKMKLLLDVLYKNCPVGVGGESFLKLSDKELDDVALKGARFAVERGIGTEEDLLHCEANGCLEGADPSCVTPRARARGREQLGTVGAGNHFVEIQIIDKIYQQETANAFGIIKEDQVVVMIHCGSRGFGHQICTDYIRMMEEGQPGIVSNLADHNLIYAPLQSPLAKQYWGAMNAAANFAFCNRHILGSQVRKSFEEVFGDIDVKTVYDVCHNIAKRETHTVQGAQKEVLVHRKGATRAFPAGHKDIPEAYRIVGQPVIIPGSMGTASYVLVGTQRAMHESFGSTAHGAGRTMSRMRAKRDYPAEMVKEELARNNVSIKAASLKGISEEAPAAYKDVDEVIRVCDEAGLAKKVARLRPIGVIKG